jgi:hypothetical protein
MPPFAPVLNYIARNRLALAIACFAATPFIYRYQAELDPLPPDAIEVLEAESHVIGTLEVQVRGRREQATVARRDAGFAMEYIPRQDLSAVGAASPVRMMFATELALTEAEIRWIRGHGPQYRIGIARNEIVTIGSTTQPLISYERYSLLAAAKRDRWRVFGALAIVLGVTLYAIGHWRHAKTDA